MEAVVMNAFIVVVGLFGLFECFWGYRLFNITLRIFGFLLGAAVGSGLGLGFTNGNAIAAIFAGLLGGVILSVIIVALRKLGIFMIGACLGLLVGSLFALAGLNHILVFVMLAIAGGILAVVMDKLMIILSTAIGGAWLAVFGIANLFIGNANFLPNLVFGSQARGMSALLIALVLAWIALSVVGILVQYEKIPLQQYVMDRLPIEQLRKKWGSKNDNNDKPHRSFRLS